MSGQPQHAVTWFGDYRVECSCGWRYGSVVLVDLCRAAARHASPRDGGPARDALTQALDAGIREWENAGGPLLPILDRHVSAAVVDATALAERLTAVKTLVESWPHGDNGQDYRRAVTQCRAAVLAVLAAASTSGGDE